MNPTDKKSLREHLYQRHRRGAIFRSGASACLWFSALLAYIIGTLKINEFIGISISLLVLVLMNPPTLWGLRRISNLRHYNLFSLFINELEIICYTGIIYFAGGIEAAYLAIIYCLLIAYAGMVAPRKTPFIVAGLCSVTFAIMVFSEYAGLLPRFRLIDSWGNYPSYPFSDQFVSVAIVVALLFVMAFFASYTSRLIRTREVKLKKVNEALLKEIEERKKAVTALLESEEKLTRLKRMESLGIMAGGIAHDLNNILSGIVTIPDLILMKMPDADPLRRKIEIIKESGQRAAGVVSELLTLAKGVAVGQELLNINTVISECFESTEFKNLKNMNQLINFKTQLEPDLLNIKCSSLHIQKCALNLMKNATDAIMDAGTIVVSTRNCCLDKTINGYQDIPEGEYAVLSVSDNGTDIPAKDLERIFEPFYTKRAMGRKGTGLELSIVWNTVSDHDGFIDVKSGPAGSVFELYFPVTRDKSDELKEIVCRDDYFGNGEKILVVDDEEGQREIVCSLLNHLNYNATAVSSGEEAVDYMKKNRPDLIILDMILHKGMNGRQTYEKIIKIHPGQKAVIASGFSETDEVKKAQQLGAGKFIKKPYTIEKIGLAVKEELGRSNN